MNKKLIPAYLLTFVNVLGLSILMPVLPFVVESYGGAKWVYGLLLSLYAAFQFIGSPYLGALSDSVGRKPVLLISHGGTLLSWLVFLIALSLPEFPLFTMALPLWVIGLSRITDGFTGGNISVTNAYVSDITSLEEKSYIFGYLGGISGIAFVIGPGIGGLTASTPLGHTGTLLAAIFISSLTMLTIFMWLKESLPKEKRQPRRKQSLTHSLFIFKRIKAVQPKPLIKLIFTMKFFFSMMMAFYISTIPLFVIDLFEFDEKQLGMFMLVVGLFMSFNQAFLAKKFIIRFGEFNTLLIGLTLSAIGIFGITLTENFWLYVAIYYIMNLGISLSFPTFNSLISIHANPKKQGEIMGISESISSFTMAVFPVLATAIYGMIGFYLYHFICTLPLIALITAIIKGKHLAKGES